MKFFSILISLVVCALLATTLVSAAIQVIYHNDTLKTEYGVGDKVIGLVNASFENIFLDAPIRTNLGHNTTVRKLLNANHHVAFVNYTCNTLGCNDSYSVVSPITQITLADNEALMALSVGGKGVRNIEKVSVLIQGQGAPSCSSPLTLDITGRDQQKLTSFSYVDQPCATLWGCFETNKNSYQQVTIPYNEKYCERVNISAAPALRLGAHVFNSTNGAPGLVMELFSKEGTFLSGCDLPKLPAAEATVECLIKQNVAQKKDHYVCIRAKGNSNYKIRAESNEVCGTNDLGSTYSLDYEVFVKPLKFNTPSINLTDANFAAATGINLGDYLSTYIQETYGGSCSPSCAIPLLLTGENQATTISKVHIQYDIDGGQDSESTTVYSAKKALPFINSGPILLDIGLANFTFPNDFDDNLLNITVGIYKFIEKKINFTTTFEFTIKPTFATFGKDTEFTAEASTNITSSTWNFGDGTTQTASGKTIVHRYATQGTFAVQVEVTRKDGKKSKRTFEISVGNAKDAANDTLTLYDKQLDSLETLVGSYPAWVQTVIRSSLNVSSFRDQLTNLQTQFTNAQNDSQFEAIVTQLQTVRIPSALDVSLNGTLPIFIGANNLDAGLLEELEGNTTGNEEALREGIVGWMNEHYEGEIEFSHFKVTYPSGSEPLLTKFKLYIRPKGTAESAHLFIGYPANEIHFASSTGVQEISSAAALSVQGLQTVEFIIEGQVQPADLGIYIAPSLATLGITAGSCEINGICSAEETSASCPDDCASSSKGIYIALGVLIILAAGAYFGMRWWYKNKYESSLFKRSQDLTNLMTFITTGRSKGLKDADIQKRLLTSGWKNEQIAYAFKKTDAVRSKAPDARFIKR